MLEIKIANGDKKPKVIVEAGHIYTNEIPGQEHQIGAEIGSLVANLFTMVGYEVQKLLFVDNYNPTFEDKPQSLDLWNYLNFLEGCGFSPDKVIYEMEMAQPAKEALDFLVENNFAGQHDLTGKFLLNKGNILLYDPETERFSCSLLDACLYQQKLKESAGTITVLDQQYSSQQKGTLTILKKLGVDTSGIAPFYYNTPNAVIHESSSPKMVYGPNHKVVLTNGYSRAAVPEMVTLLKLFGKISEINPLNTSLNLEVLKHVF